MSKLSFETPNEQTKRCNFVITSTVDDTVPKTTSQYAVYVVLNYNDATSDPLTIPSQSEVSAINSGAKPTRVIAMQKNGNVWSLVAEVKRPTSYIGMTLIVVVNDAVTSSYYDTVMSSKNPSPHRDVNLTQGVVRLSENLGSQMSTEVGKYHQSKPSFIVPNLKK